LSVLAANYSAVGGTNELISASDFRNVWNARINRRVTDNKQQKRFFMRWPVQDPI